MAPAIPRGSGEGCRPRAVRGWLAQGCPTGTAAGGALAALIRTGPHGRVACRGCKGADGPLSCVRQAGDAPRNRGMQAGADTPPRRGGLREEACKPEGVYDSASSLLCRGLRPRQADKEGGALRLRGVALDGAPVGGDNALNDEEPQPKAFARGVHMAPLEGLEDVGLERLGDAGPSVVNAQAGLVLRGFQLYVDGSARRAVLERIAQQVGDNLGQPIRVPLAACFWWLGEPNVPLRMRGPVLVHHLPDDCIEVRLARADRYAASHTRPGQVQQISYNAKLARSALEVMRRGASPGARR